MKTSIVIAFIFCLLAAGCTTTYLNLKENNTEQIEEKIIDNRQDEDVGIEVILSLQNGKEINGELLSVRENTLIICTEHSATEEELTRLKYPIKTFQNDEIKEMTIEGSNYVFAGLGIGIAAGTGIGYLVGLASEPSHSDFAWAPEFGGGVLGFGVGALAGPIAGYLLSTDDVMLQEIPSGYDMSFLKPFARYPEEEPEYLKAIE